MWRGAAWHPRSVRVEALLSSLGFIHGPDEYEAALNAVGGTWSWTQDLSAADAQLNGTDLGLNEVREWLSGLIPAATSVLVAWPAYGMGARMNFDAWLQHFDDLWHPASDDVVLIEPGGCVLVMDHEEQLAFLQR